MADATRPPITPSPSLAAPAYDGRRVRRWASIVCLALLGAYLLLQNPYWVPGGDSDFYVSIARSMARGEGFKYNGQPVAISPPGWPWVMAQVMKVSPTFLALKAVTMLSMYGSLVIGFFIALRFLKPSAAGIATVLAGLLMPVYSLTYFLHSEGLYCLLSAWALLICLRVREERALAIEKIALVLLCIGLPLVRWAGIFQLAPIAAVLLSGKPGVPIKNRHWKLAAACCLLIIGTWVGTRVALAMTPEEVQQVQDVGGDSGTDTEIVDEPPTESTSVSIVTAPKDPKRGMVHEYFDRVTKSGKWFSWLLWQPTRFIQIHKVADFFVGLLGWGVIALLGFLAISEARRGEWIWVSLAAYTGGICINWDNINSRYFVPVAPLILVGLLLATRRLHTAVPTRNIDVWKWVRRGLVYSVLLCNLAMYGVDVIVMRSANFYETFEAGQHKDLIAATRFLMSLPTAPPPTTAPAGKATTRAAATSTSAPSDVIVYRPEDGQLLVNERYENLGKPKSSKSGTRAMVLLTDRFVKPLDGKYTRIVRPPVTSPKLAKIMRARRAEWYFAQAPAVPWRLWHFKVPDWVQAKLSKSPVGPASGGWMLYRFDRINSTFTPYPFPPAENWPTRVPGM